MEEEDIERGLEFEDWEKAEAGGESGTGEKGKGKEGEEEGGGLLERYQRFVNIARLRLEPDARFCPKFVLFFFFFSFFFFYLFYF